MLKMDLTGLVTDVECKEQSSPTITACKVKFWSAGSKITHKILLHCSKRKRGYEEDGHVSKEPRLAEEVGEYFAIQKLN